jgi:Protein of unknown function (DUF616)
VAALTVLTAIYGDYDHLDEPIAQTVACEFVCVTDNPLLRSSTWDVIHDPMPGVPPRMAAKHPKMRPDRYTAAPASVWVDASVLIRSATFAADMLDILARSDLAQFVHPDRDCIYTEATASLPLTKYRGEPVVKQVDHYRADGHPEHWGLWAAGIIARRHNLAMRLLGDAWLAEIEQWSVQDQLSEPVVLRRCGQRPDPLPGSLHANPWLRLAPHRRED